MYGEKITENTKYTNTQCQVTVDEHDYHPWRDVFLTYLCLNIAYHVTCFKIWGIVWKKHFLLFECWL
jgi:hypothetical protein